MGKQSKKSKQHTERLPVGALHDVMGDMLAAAASYLEDAARDGVVQFVQSRMNSDGGFRGRGESSDPYYGVFALGCLLALTGDLPVRAMEQYVAGFGDGEGLDFVHLTCLARCRALLRRMVTELETEQRMLQRIETFRAADGGYNPQPKRAHAAAYAGFLAFLAYEGFQVALPEPHELLRSLRSLRLADGAYINEEGSAAGNTPATSAAAILNVHLGEPGVLATREWLLAQCDRRGGFRAVQNAPQPDLLSTATALLALRIQKADLAAIRTPCMDFVESLWDPGGGFRGHAADPTPDCEYTFYGLLALGALAG